MRALRAWLVRLAFIFRRTPLDTELREELDSHLQMHISDNVRAGMTKEEARRQALIKLGGITQTEELYRDRRGLPFLDALAQDLRYSVRVLSKSRGFTFVAVLTLALGIAVNTAVFTAFDALVLRPRPVKDPEHLVSVYRISPGQTGGGVSYPDYIYFRDHSKSFSDLSLFAYGMAVTSSEVPATSPERSSRNARAVGFQLPQLLAGSARPIGCIFVSGNYLPMYGETPLLGRILSAQDDQPNAPPVVLISGNLWQRQFHSDPKVVGSVLHLNGVGFTVVGVTQINYLAGLPAVPDLWAPISAKVHVGFSAKDLANRLVSAGIAGGRLKPGVSMSEAQEELNVLAAQLRESYSESEHNASIKVLSASNNLADIDPEMWGVVAAAISAVALLLLIACANVASLLLGRAVARRKEIAVRLALGAGRWRLLRQLLTESMLLALLAGAIGLPLGGWMLHILVLQIASALPSYWGTIVLALTPDVLIFAYTFFLSCGAGVAFGLSPALQASKADVNVALKEEGMAFGQRVSRARLRSLLIGGQIAACLVLLVSSALLLLGSQRALKIDPGYESRHIVALEMYDPANLHYSQARLLQLNRDIIQDISALPGVQSVAQASRGPIGGIRWVPVAPLGAAVIPLEKGASEQPAAGYSYVTPNYFESLGIPIVRGRNFTPREAEGQSPVVIISEATARRFWPTEN